MGYARILSNSKLVNDIFIAIYTSILVSFPVSLWKLKIFYYYVHPKVFFHVYRFLALHEDFSDNEVKCVETLVNTRKSFVQYKRMFYFSYFIFLTSIRFFKWLFLGRLGTIMQLFEMVLYLYAILLHNYAIDLFLN